MIFVQDPPMDSWLTSLGFHDPGDRNIPLLKRRRIRGKGRLTVFPMCILLLRRVEASSRIHEPRRDKFPTRSD